MIVSPLDKLYLRDINNKGGDAQAISCDALSKEDKSLNLRAEIPGFMKDSAYDSDSVQLNKELSQIILPEQEIKINLDLDTNLQEVKKGGGKTVRK